MPATPEKYGILLAAFGASGVSGEHALLVFEKQVQEKFPNIPIRWAFTSGHMRNKLALEKVKSDSVHKALKRMSFERYTHVAIQSLHLINGVEYENMQEEVLVAAGQCKIKASIGTPLLHSTEDVQKTALALMESLPKQRKENDAVVCMGHGTWHSGASRYDDLSQELNKRSSGIFIGTLEGEHQIENLLPSIIAFAPEKVWLLPLLSLVGKHAIKDMAGDEPESWKNQIQAKGIPCTPVLKGTAEYPHFISIWLEHLQTSFEELKS